MPRQLAPCGTEAAYYRHRRLDEPVDAACRAANSTAKREAEQKRRDEPTTASRTCPCGTQLKTAHDHCSRCRRKASFAEAKDTHEHLHDKPSPDRWVRRGLIWYPVYDKKPEAA